MFVGSFSFITPRVVLWRELTLGIAAMVAILAVGAGVAHADPLTLDQALRLAENRSRMLVAQDAAASAARDMAVAAAQLPDPTLKAGINNLPVNGADRFSLTRDFMTMRSVGVAQEFTRSDKRQARAARFDREAETAQAKRTLALANLQRDTAITWLDRYYQERMREALIAQRDEAKLLIEAADAAYRGGRGSQADVFAARSGVAQVEDRIAETERQVATAATQLSRWTGGAAGQELGAPPNTEMVALDHNSLEHVLLNHPQIEVMGKQEEAARAEVEIARANKHADWSSELMYSQRGSAYSNMISINVSIPLQWDQANRQDRELSAKLALAEQMRDEREEAIRVHVAETRALLQEWQSDRERIKRYDDSLIPLAMERQRATLAAYRGGSGLLSAVLEARRSEIDTRLERLRLAMDAARRWAQLNYLIPAGPSAAAASSEHDHRPGGLP